MFRSAALTFQHSAIGNNCYTADCEVVGKRSTLDWFKESIGLAVRTPVFIKTEPIDLCSAGEFAGVLYVKISESILPDMVDSETWNNVPRELRQYLRSSRLLKHI